MNAGKFKNNGLAFKRNMDKKKSGEKKIEASLGPRSQLSGMLDNSFKSFKSMESYKVSRDGWWIQKPFLLLLRNLVAGIINEEKNQIADTKKVCEEIIESFLLKLEDSYFLDQPNSPVKIS